MNADGLSDE